MASADTMEDEEPIEIEDFSCANPFEESVEQVEAFLRRALLDSGGRRLSEGHFSHTGTNYVIELFHMMGGERPAPSGGGFDGMAVSGWLGVKEFVLIRPLAAMAPTDTTFLSIVVVAMSAIPLEKRIPSFLVHHNGGLQCRGVLHRSTTQRYTIETLNAPPSALHHLDGLMSLFVMNMGLQSREQGGVLIDHRRTLTLPVPPAVGGAEEWRGLLRAIHAGFDAAEGRRRADALRCGCNVCPVRSLGVCIQWWGIEERRATDDAARSSFDVLAPWLLHGARKVPSDPNFAILKSVEARWRPNLRNVHEVLCEGSEKVREFAATVLQHLRNVHEGGNGGGDGRRRGRSAASHVSSDVLHLLQRRVLSLDDVPPASVTMRAICRGRPCEEAVANDPRMTYVPYGIANRVAEAMLELSHVDDMYALWLLVVDALQTSAHDVELYQRLNLPVGTAPHPRAPLFVQKIQLVSYCTEGGGETAGWDAGDAWDEAMFTPRDNGPGVEYTSDVLSNTEENAGEGAAVASTSPQPSAGRKPMRLLTDGSPMVIPPPEPPRPMTRDVEERLQREAMTLGSSGAAQWMRSEPLLRDMVQFRLSNAPHPVVLADFVHWYSPRDFVEGGKLEANGEDSSFLSERMRGPNHWRSVWEASANAAPPPAWSATAEKEMAMQWLQRNATQEEILVASLHANVSTMLHRLMDGAVVLGPQVRRHLEGIAMNIARFLREADDLWAADGAVEMLRRRYAEVVGLLQEAERMVFTHAALMHTCLPPDVDLPPGLGEAAAAAVDECVALSDVNDERVTTLPSEVLFGVIAPLMAGNGIRWKSTRGRRWALWCTAERPVNAPATPQRIVYDVSESGVATLAMSLSESEW